MPLVTLTCSNAYYPQDSKHVEQFPFQVKIIELAETLPKLIIQHADSLHLEEGTPENAVQVDIKKFHTFAVNNVDLWVHVWFSESWSSEDIRTDVRDMLIAIVQSWLDQYELKLKWALDIAYGPTNGCIANATGEIRQRW